MKKRLPIFFAIFSSPLIVQVSFAQPPFPDAQKSSINEQEPEALLNFEEQKKALEQEIKIPFSFKSEPITNIVNMLARLKKINIIEPSDETYKKLTVTFANDDLISIDEAWNLLQTFLKLGGYAVTLRGPEYSIVPRINPQTGQIVFQKEVLPLYINVEPDDLPFTDAPIRAMFFLENLAFPPPGAGNADPLSTILKDMLSVGSVPIFDPETKSIILTDSANLIASAMKVIYALDRGGVQETVEIVPLYNTNAGDVVLFLRTGLGITGGQATNQPAYLTRTQRPEGHPYFAQNTAIVADIRKNALILLGRETQVDRLKQFIEEYIDVPPDKGETILHTYDLQYLESAAMADILREIFAPIVTATPTGQAEVTTVQAGPERYFQNPVIVAETYTQVAPTEAIAPPVSPLEHKAVLTGVDIATLRPFQGGNRLIIAALTPDWERIEELLQKIDRPTRQVIIEALVVEVSFTDDKILRGAIRNPKAMGLEPGQSFQSQHLLNVPTDALVYDATSTLPTGIPIGDLSVDLLKTLAQSPGNTLANFATPGSLLISFRDPTKGGIWGLLEIFQGNNDFKILQHPSVVTATNVTATIAFQELRRDFGTVAAGAGGALTIPVVDVTAQIALSITPRTSSDDRVNLTIAVEVSDFPNQASGDPNNVVQFDRRNRGIGTNLNLSNNQVVALGGLVSSTTRTSETRAPILSRIPFFGNFFRGITKQEDKSNLVIFISARIVPPRGRTHTGPYTDEKLSRSLYHMDDYDLFSTLQDPITHIFFRKKYDEKHVINDFLLETEGTMLDPDTYEHEFCNDEKLASKVTAMGVPGPKPPHTNQVIVDRQSIRPVPPAKSADEVVPHEVDANATERENLKELLAQQENPLVRTRDTDNN